MTSQDDLGIDIKCTDDLDPYLSTLNGPLNVAWALAWRMRTPRGGLFYALDYGKSLAIFCHGEIDRSTLQSCRTGLESEARKDPRVKSASAKVTWNPATRTLRTQIEGRSSAGPWSLVASVSAASVDLLTVQG